MVNAEVNDTALAKRAGVLEKNCMKLVKTMSKAFLLGTGLVFAAHTAHADPADLDTTFSSDGLVTSAFGTSGIATARAIKIQSDGKIITAGEYGGNWAIARHTSAGVLDTSFNSDGKVTTNYGGTDGALGVDIQSDGKIVAVGYGQGLSLFCVTRYLSNGTHDTTFDGDGKVGYNFGVSDTRGTCIAIQSDGKIVVGGFIVDGTGHSDFVVARLTSTGALDTTFSTDGWTSIDFGDNDNATALAIQSDGKIVVTGTAQVNVGGNANNNVAVARLTSSGALDTTFSGDGKVTVDLGSTSAEDGRAIAIQSDGKIVVAAGYTYQLTVNGQPQYYTDFLALRFTSTGSLDTTFSGDGIVTTNLSAITNPGDDSTAVAVQSDGKIILVGTTEGSTNGTDFGIVRYNANGTLDTSFSSDGIATTNFATNSFDAAYAVAIQSDGKIVVAGQSNAGATTPNTDASFALARYLGTPVTPSPIKQAPQPNTTSNPSAQSS